MKWVKSIDLPSAARPQICQLVVAQDKLRAVLDELERGTVDLAALDPQAPGAKVMPPQALLVSALGNDATRSRTFIGETEPEVLFSNPEDVSPPLDALTDALNLDFRGRFINHVGAFDVIEAPPWAEKVDPFVVTALRAAGDLPDHAVLIARRGEVTDPCTVHVIVTNASNDVIMNRLVTFPRCVAEVPCRHRIVPMGGRHKQEFEPLLGLGFHQMSLLQVRQLCVDADWFKLSQRRKIIMDNLDMIFERLTAAMIVGEAWINGRFLTKKIEPCDADFVLHVDAELYDNGTPQQRGVIDWIISNLKSEYWCDTYHLFRYEQSHPLYAEYDWNRAFYQARFGWSEEMDTKGIAVVSLPGSAK